MKTTPQARGLFLVSLLLISVTLLLLYFAFTWEGSPSEILRKNAPGLLFVAFFLIRAYHDIKRGIFLTKMYRKYGYEWLGEFKDNRAIATRNEKMFHIDKETYLPSYSGRFDDLEAFKDGFARVKDNDDVYLIDVSGKRKQ